jgi:hypothetical protein
VTLLELEPRWIMKDGRRIGFTFISPVQRVRQDGSFNPTPWRQSCFVVPTPMHQQFELFEAMYGAPFPVQPCNQQCAWTVAGGIEQASFRTMTVTPSLDGSAGRLWHGFITNGEIVGGI